MRTRIAAALLSLFCLTGLADRAQAQTVTRTVTTVTSYDEPVYAAPVYAAPVVVAPAPLYYGPRYYGPRRYNAYAGYYAPRRIVHEEPALLNLSIGGIGYYGGGRGGYGHGGYGHGGYHR